MSDRYKSAYEYDANGNIVAADRYDQDGQQYDALTYHYRKKDGRVMQNRLYELVDMADEGNLLVNPGPGEDA